MLNIYLFIGNIVVNEISLCFFVVYVYVDFCLNGTYRKGFFWLFYLKGYFLLFVSFLILLFYL